MSKGYREMSATQTGIIAIVILGIVGLLVLGGVFICSDGSLSIGE